MSKNSVLIDLLNVIVKEWGYKDVVQSLRQIGNTSIKDSQDALRQLEIEPGAAQPQGADKRRRPTAPEMVEKLEIPPEKRNFLMKLAIRFEDKTFLPGVGDVRNFLEMRGKESKYITNRNDAFRQIAQLVLELPDDGVEKILRFNAHSGPSQLGPLSEAIKSTSEAVRSSPRQFNHGAEESGDAAGISRSNQIRRARFSGRIIEKKR